MAVGQRQTAAFEATSQLFDLIDELRSGAWQHWHVQGLELDVNGRKYTFTRRARASDLKRLYVVAGEDVIDGRQAVMAAYE